MSDGKSKGPKLNPADLSRYRALLSKYDRREDEFRLNEAHLRAAPDGSAEGSIWVIHVGTGRGVTFYIDRFRSNWLDAFENYLQQDIFPRES